MALLALAMPAWGCLPVPCDDPSCEMVLGRDPTKAEGTVACTAGAKVMGRALIHSCHIVEDGALAASKNTSVCRVGGVKRDGSVAVSCTADADCEADGSYKRRQCSGSTGMCWCVNPVTGKRLPAIDGVNEGEACESRCEAARSRVLSSNSLTAFIPECNAKDIFRSCQCNRMKECRCVDKYTGEPAMCRAAGGCQPFVATVVAADPALGNGTYYTLQNANRYRFRLTRESVNSTDVAEGDEMLVALGNDGWATLVQPLPRQGAAQNHASGLPWAAVLAGVGAAAVLAVAAIFAANYRNARQFREVPDSSDVESVANESRARNGSCYVQEEESPGLAS
eukprot:TRINITY_DN517_c0_g2_i4.p2 TRINITY_DN517_c0_g2~~TRINITY_DN517_c0_g2_i4.p2  ORF type:complete len:364 (+),score=55.48 TRINITY_DN517_c0_g2_i4:79-1092(+)